MERMPQHAKRFLADGKNASRADSAKHIQIRSSSDVPDLFKVHCLHRLCALCLRLQHPSLVCVSPCGLHWLLAAGTDARPKGRG